MTSHIISIENLSKKFIITHETSERYTALRDVITNKAKSLLGKSSKTKHTEEDFWALKDVNISIQQGDRIGIIGRNGAGKSTLLKILSRITEPTEGKIKIRGRVASLLEVGTGFHPELSGRENIYLNGAILGMSRSEITRKFDEIVSFAEVERFLDTPVKRYSSGMYVRLAFAVAAHLEPEILIVDEVLAVGDAQFQKKCLGKMQDVSNKEGRTIIFVSHHMATIKSLCNSIVYMKSGSVVDRGPVERVIANYLGDYKISNESGIIERSFPRKYSNGEAFFSKIRVMNTRSEYASEFSFGEHICVEFEIDVVKDLEPCIVNILIGTSSGDQVLFCADTSSSKYQSVNLKNGRNRIFVTVRSKLLPNSYNVSALIAYVSNGTPVDWVENISSFTVSNVGHNTGADYPWGVIHGFVEPVSDWDYELVG
jgi:lipopolysaccharide transport system ATP-binding protein